MPLRHLIFTTRAAAIAFFVRIRNASGLPRCDCPDHSDPPRPWPAAAPPCPCTSARGAGVVRTCDHASSAYYRVRTALIAGVRRWAFRTDPHVRAQMTGPELAAEVDETAAWDGATEDD